MTGRSPIGLAMGVALALALAMAAAIAFLGTGKHDESGGAPGRAAQVTASGLTAQDSAVLAGTRPSVRDWNAANDGWIRALEAGRERFLGRYEAYTRRMNIDSLRIRLSAAKIQNPRLKSLVKRLGDVYRKQFMAIRSANQAVVAADQPAGQRALARLERADDERIRVATALIDAFPELGGDLNRLR